MRSSDFLTGKIHARTVSGLRTGNGRCTLVNFRLDRAGYQFETSSSWFRCCSPCANGPVPFWVMFSCYAAMGLGTLIGGWRIVHTMGSRITRLRPFQGFCAETGGAITLFTATYFGIPVSTTHTITGAIIGVGAARSVSSVRWKVANNIVFAWIVTIPATAFMAALFYALAGLFG